MTLEISKLKKIFCNVKMHLLLLEKFSQSFTSRILKKYILVQFKKSYFNTFSCMEDKTHFKINFNILYAEELNILTFFYHLKLPYFIAFIQCTLLLEGL